MNNRLTIIAILLLATFKIQAQQPVEKGLAVINKNTIQAQVGFLASDWFNGREAATEGAYMAADYLASIYQQMDIAPAGENNSYFQKVPLVIFQAPAKPLMYATNGGTTVRLKPGQEFSISPITMGYKISGKVAWMGYGTEGKAKSMTEKVAIRVAGQPEGSNIDAKELELQKSKFLAESGAIAVLEYDPADPYMMKNFKSGIAKGGKAENPTSEIYSRRYLLPGEEKSEIPVIKISKTVLQQLMTDVDNQINNFVAKNSTPKVEGSIEISARIAADYKYCRNVVAIIEGSEYPDEIIVVGGHYDHLGASNGLIWNGADDNASGAIGTATIAAAFMATGVQPKRTIIFANWTAEERGLLGSRYFVANYDKIGKVKYYHNYDMIGRSYDHKKSDMAVSMMYTDTWKQAGELTTKFNHDYKLGLNINLSAWDNPVSGSDNGSFAKVGIPIMWYHTGGHPEYHQPGDHAEKIDWQKMESIIKNSFLTLWELANE